MVIINSAWNWYSSISDVIHKGLLLVHVYTGHIWLFLCSTWSSNQSWMLTHPEITKKSKYWIWMTIHTHSTPVAGRNLVTSVCIPFHSTHNPCTFELALGRIHHTLQYFQGSYLVHPMMSHGHVCVHDVHYVHTCPVPSLSVLRNLKHLVCVASI